jgi:hypothetical protein
MRVRTPSVKCTMSPRWLKECTVPSTSRFSRAQHAVYCLSVYCQITETHLCAEDRYTHRTTGARLTSGLRPTKVAARHATVLPGRRRRGNRGIRRRQAEHTDDDGRGGDDGRGKMHLDFFFVVLESTSTICVPRGWREKRQCMSAALQSVLLFWKEILKVLLVGLHS